jgi:hypothetical protein
MGHAVGRNECSKRPSFACALHLASKSFLATQRTRSGQKVRPLVVRSTVPGTNPVENTSFVFSERFERAHSAIWFSLAPEAGL